jgi:hypothetical protein
VHLQNATTAEVMHHVNFHSHRLYFYDLGVCKLNCFCRCDKRAGWMVMASELILLNIIKT